MRRDDSSTTTPDQHLDGAPVSGDVPRVRFADAGGARIAYQDFGGGDHTIVAIPPMAQNIETAWEWPAIRTMLERLSGFSRYLHFDKRGTGVSDRNRGVNVIDERVEDLRAVMDDAGVESAWLFALSEGGPMAILFAVTYPERVEGLVLCGTGPTGTRPDMTSEERDDYRERAARYAALWGTADSPVVDGFAPTLAADPEFRAWHQRYERSSASSDSLVDLLELVLDIDVRDVLGEVSAPTLVLHRRGDRIIPFEWGEELAERIPGAHMVALDGDDHFPYVGDQGWIDEVERFITGQVTRRKPAPRRATRIRTLGEFAVERDGVDVPVSEWGSKRARQLLKRLVAARGWPVTRDELIDLLWPDEHDMSRLSPRLSVLLSAVRRVLGGGIVANRESVRLDLNEVSTDLEDFYKADSDAAVVAAYAGDFLPEDIYEDWTTPPRDEARLRFRAAARRLIETDTRAGVHVRAAGTARRLVESDPYDLDAHELLVGALEAAGAEVEAERAADQLRALKVELGIDS